MINVRKLWENSNITARFPGLAARARLDEPMREHTTFKVGGPADIFVEPVCVEELIAIVGLFSSEGVPVSVLGGGSNLLVADRGIRGAVVSLSRLDSITVPSPPDGFPPGLVPVRVGAGRSMNSLTEWCADRDLAGLERFAGLPGSVGGAVFMNARCYDIAIADVFFAAECLQFGTEGCTIQHAGLVPGEWAYKASPFQRREGPDPLVLSPGSRIVLSVDLALRPGKGDGIRAEMERYARDRTDKGHFRYPSAGSMFKNNRDFGSPSGKIIDEVGLRGFRIGDAQVAPWHGNFVINLGSATAADLRELVDKVRQRVFESTGFMLESEVILAGEW